MRYKAIVSYDGSNYYGYQSQKNVKNIQDEIEFVLEKINKKKTPVVASGRTDRNVHALGQVFHFDSELALEKEKWLLAINSLLPYDIRVVDIKRVKDNFHARFDVKEKRYDYYLNMGQYDLFKRDYISQYNCQLDYELMRKAALIFLGTHDFTSFCSNTLKETPNQIRTIKKLEIKKEKEILHFIFVGDGFLRYMVRMIVGALIEVGKNRLSLDEVQSILDAKDKKACRYKALAQGLYLVKVKY